MNKVILIGRLTKDPELRYSQGPEALAILNFSIAIDRRGKDQGADFPTCVAFGKNAENINEYFHKGNKIALWGSLQTDSYTDKDGKKVYTTKVIVNEWEFVESKGESAVQEKKADEETKDGDFMNIPEGVDELPFN